MPGPLMGGPGGFGMPPPMGGGMGRSMGGGGGGPIRGKGRGGSNRYSPFGGMQPSGLLTFNRDPRDIMNSVLNNYGCVIRRQRLHSLECRWHPRVHCFLL